MHPRHPTSSLQLHHSRMHHLLCPIIRSRPLLVLPTFFTTAIRSTTCVLPPPSPIADYKPLTPASRSSIILRIYFHLIHSCNTTPLPPRPASAKPHPQMLYYDTSLAPGLPTSAAHLPLPVSYGPSQSVESSPQYHADSEEGKGHRASRISQTLRLSSRNRSVSPLSHRYPLPQPSAQHVSPRRPHPGAIISPIDCWRHTLPESFSWPRYAP